MYDTIVTLLYMIMMFLQVLNAEKVSLSCDIFSLGVVFWELLTHKRPFDGKQGIPVAMMITRGDVS